MSERMSQEELGKLKVGQLVRVTRGEEPHFKEGDLATLLHIDVDGDWWGVIEGVDYKVCLTENGAIEALNPEQA